MSLLREFWLRKRWALLITLLIGWLASVGTFLLSISIGAFFDIHYQSLTNRSRLLKMLGVELEGLGQFFVFFFVVALLKAGLTLWEKQRITLVADRFTDCLVRRLFTTQIGWSPERFNRKAYSKYLLRYSGDMNSVRNLIIGGLHGVAKDLLFLLSGLSILFLLSVPLTSVLALSLLAYFPLIAWIDQHQKPRVRRKRDQKSLLLSLVTDSFGQHHRLQEDATLHDTLMKKFQRRIRKQFRANRAYQHSDNIRQVMAPLLGHLLTGLLLWRVSTLSPIEISGGALLVYLLVLSSVIPPLRRLFKAPAIWQRGLLSLRKIDIIFQQEEKSASQDTPLKSSALRLV